MGVLLGMILNRRLFRSLRWRAKMDKEIKDVFTLDLETTNGNKTDTQEQKCGNME